jgi:hypothetical protein
MFHLIQQFCSQFFINRTNIPWTIMSNCCNHSLELIWFNNGKRNTTTKTKCWGYFIHFFMFMNILDCFQFWFYYINNSLLVNISIFLLPNYFCLKYFGSNPIIRNRKDYLGKRLQVFFPKNNFYVQMNFWMKCFVTCFKQCSNFLQSIIVFLKSLLNKYEFLKVCKFLIDSMFHLEKLSKF